MTPVPKNKQKTYGKIVGKNINEGKSLEESKDIADEAVKKKKENPKVSVRKNGKKKD
jgi:hypothetical protein